jgi:hypothetical protein
LQIFDHVPLAPVYPSGEDQHQKLERQSVHRFNLRPNRSRKFDRKRQSQRAARPWRYDGFSSADFWHTTGARGPIRDPASRTIPLPRQRLGSSPSYRS